jgi:hypothetical protein
MDLLNLDPNTVVIAKAGDFQEAYHKLAAKHQAPAPTNETPISQSEAILLWKTTRQRLARLRRLGLLEGLMLNGRIFYRPQAYAEAMQSLNRSKKPLM